MNEWKFMWIQLFYFIFLHFNLLVMQNRHFKSPKMVYFGSGVFFFCHKPPSVWAFFLFFHADNLNKTFFLSKSPLWSNLWAEGDLVLLLCSQFEPCLHDCCAYSISCLLFLVFFCASFPAPYLHSNYSVLDHLEKVLWMKIFLKTTQCLQSYC